MYFLHGEEDHLREEAIEEVLNAHLDPSTRDFNFDQLRGADVGPEDLASMLATPPMMAANRVVLVRDVQGLSQKAREVVEQVVASPPEGLVLILSGQKPSGSKARFYDVLQKAARTVEYPRLGLNDLPGWLTDRAREEHGLELELDAARALVGAIGSHLGVLSTELDGDGNVIGVRLRNPWGVDGGPIQGEDDGYLSVTPAEIVASFWAVTTATV